MIIASVDTALFQLINKGYNAPWLDTTMQLISNKYFWIPLYLIVIYAIVKKFKKKAVVVLLCLIAAVSISDYVASGILKNTFQRTRPCNEISLQARVLVNCSDSGSMPSSHAATHFCIAFFLIIGVFKKDACWISCFFWLWAISISLSRTYCGVHYPSDLLVGALLGMGIALMFLKLSNYIIARA